MVHSWTAGAVRQAAAERVWVPPAADQILTSEYQVIAYPRHFQHATQVAWSKSDRPAAELIDDVTAQVLVAARMALAREHGATLALVKGLVETSGPILQRCGFTAYGEERSYCLPV